MHNYHQKVVALDFDLNMPLRVSEVVSSRHSKAKHPTTCVCYVFLNMMSDVCAFFKVYQ